MTIDDLLKEDKDWRITDKQRSMISDKMINLSRKEASLLIKIIEAIFQNRTPEPQKLQENKI